MHPIEPPTQTFYRRSRVSILGSILTIIFCGTLNTSWAQAPGEKEFTTICIACHTIGEGRRVGPDLAGVTDRRPEDWLMRFIKSSQSVIGSGDAYAVALANDYPGLVMPDTALSDQQIKDILDYVKSKSPLSPEGADESLAIGSALAPVPEPIKHPQPASEEEILAGRHYFQGEIRFKNGGAACNSCHDVRHDAVIGGGVLAVDLTTVFSRMGGTGVKAILGQAPFPVMQSAYKGKPLTEEEVTSLVAFLQFADSEEYNQLPRDYGMGLFLTGTTGAGVLFLLFGTIWRRRKDGSVYQSIYDRQIKS